MLDFADFVAINKFDRRGAEDALRDVRRQVRRNREAFGSAPEEMPVFGTDRGPLQRRRRHRAVPAISRELLGGAGPGPAGRHAAAGRDARRRPAPPPIVPPARSRYLAEIAETVRGYHAETERQVEAVARSVQQLRRRVPRRC